MQKQTTTAKENRLPALVRGAIVGIAVIFLFMLLCSFLITKCSLPPSSAPLLLIPILLLGGFSGGFSAASHLKQDGLVCGAVVGAVLAAIELLAVVIATGEIPSGNALTKGIILLCSAMVGGILGVNRKPRRIRR